MHCPKCNNEMWDNRGKKRNPKAPDFRCKDEMCDGVIWPPKDGQPYGVRTERSKLATVGSVPIEQSRASTVYSVKGDTHGAARLSKDDYWTRKDQRDADREQRNIEKDPQIMRQHSQHMALIYFGIANTIPTTTQLREMTSWFQRDIRQSPDIPHEDLP